MFRRICRSIKIRFLLWACCLAGVIGAWFLPMTLLDGLEQAVEVIRLETIDYNPSG
jgi:hypothetical protein